MLAGLAGAGFGGDLCFSSVSAFPGSARLPAGTLGPRSLALVALGVSIQQGGPSLLVTTSSRCRPFFATVPVRGHLTREPRHGMMRSFFLTLWPGFPASFRGPSRRPPTGMVTSLSRILHAAACSSEGPLGTAPFHGEESEGSREGTELNVLNRTAQGGPGAAPAVTSTEGTRGGSCCEFFSPRHCRGKHRPDKASSAGIPHCLTDPDVSQRAIPEGSGRNKQPVCPP